MYIKRIIDEEERTRVSYVYALYVHWWKEVSHMVFVYVY